MAKFGLLLLFQASVGLVILSAVNEVQKEAYMDEIFHIPQAQKYCNGNISEWDPMITTLPGLYLMSATLLAPVGRILHLPVSSVCGTFALRGINLGFLLANVLLLYMLSCVIHGKREKALASLNAASIGFFPVLYLISFLYYTDPGSVFWVLLMYLSCLQQADYSAALCGIVAVLFRQTNIVWVVFMAGVACENIVIEWLTRSCKKIKVNICSMVVLKYVIKYVIDSLTTDYKDICYLLKNIVQKVIAYFLVVVMFMIFVFINDGIVVGDKAHHQACFNLPQLFYFLCTTLAFGFWHMLSRGSIKKCFHYATDHPFTICAFTIVSAYFIANFTHVHEYLLADNRHYTFYVWSKIYRKHQMIKFLLIPVYFFAYYNFSMSLNHKTFFWKILFSICVFISLVPQRLLEFRYFVIPFFVWRLNIKQPSKFVLCLEIIYFSIINGITLYIFLFRPFKWANSNQQQRFMW